MKSTKSKTAAADPTSIGGYLTRMLADAEVVEQRLLGAPLDMTTDAEPGLFEIIKQIKTQLGEAKKVWG